MNTRPSSVANGALSVNLQALSSARPFVSVVVAGGSGTRFWPKSRVEYPKQYLPLSPDGRSLLRATVDRVAPMHSSVLIVTAQGQMSLAQAHAPEAAIIGEPMPRNTAAALGYAAVTVLEHVGDVPMLCVHSDQLVGDLDQLSAGSTTGEERLREVYTAGLQLVQEHDIIAAVGIAPSYPETGYGYIRRGATQMELFGEPIYHIDRFVEKPPKELAEEFLKSGEYCWNAGMFLWRPSVLLKEMREHIPDLYLGLEKIRSAIKGEDADRAISEIFPTLPSISIDHGVMERSKSASMLNGTGFSWSDVGSWDSWAIQIAEQSNRSTDESLNIEIGDVLAVDCKRSAFWSDKKLIAAVGLEDIVVVETDDVILVCNRNNSHDVRKLVAALNETGRTDKL